MTEIKKLNKNNLIHNSFLTQNNSRDGGEQSINWSPLISSKNKILHYDNNNNNNNPHPYDHTCNQGTLSIP